MNLREPLEIGLLTALIIIAWVVPVPVGIVVGAILFANVVAA